MTDDNDGSPRTIPVAPDAPASGKDFVDPKPNPEGPSKTWEVPEEWRPIDTAPKDGRDVMLLIRHKNYKHSPGPKWEESVIGHWIDHNGGGWTYHGLYGTAIAWKEVR